MNYNLPDIRSIDVTHKTVLLRSDLDVPLIEHNGQKTVADDTRLIVGLPTIQYLIEKGARVIIAGHLRRPEGIDPTLSLEPVVRWLAQNFQFPISNFQFQKIGDFDGWKLSENLSVLENLRFYPGEKANDPTFAQKLAALAQIYVNDAFATCHRSQASIDSITAYLPHFAGFHLQKEITVLSQVMNNPARPLVVVVGGAKLETKLPLIEKMHTIADYVLVGGKLASETKELIHIAHEDIGNKKSVLLMADLSTSEKDITEKSTENFLEIIKLGKTIIWNGPVGITERLDSEKEIATEKGTRLIAEGIANSGAYTVVGGGDTVSYLKKINMLGKYSFFSTGGGAMLAFLSGETLPGIEALLIMKPNSSK